MMAGKPILCALNVPQCPVEVYQCGFMVRSGKTADIQQAIQNLYGMPQEEREKMGQRGKEAVVKYYNYHVLAETFEKLFYSQ